MKIKKNIAKKDGRKALLDNLLIVEEVLQEYLSRKFDSLELDDLSAHLFFDDENIDLQNINEFKTVYPSISKIPRSFFSRISFKKGDEYIPFIRCGFSDLTEDDVVEVEVESSVPELPEEVFRVILNHLDGFRMARRDPNSEAKKQQRAVVSKKARRLLEGLNQLQLRAKKKLTNEVELQDFLFPVLRSHFPDLEDEFHLPRFGSIEYKPDFGIPSSGVLIECKFLRSKADVKKIQKQITDDASGYLRASKQYSKLVVFIYNDKNTPIPEKFIKDIEKITGVEKVIIIPGVDPS